MTVAHEEFGGARCDGEGGEHVCTVGYGGTEAIDAGRTGRAISCV